MNLELCGDHRQLTADEMTVTPTPRYTTTRDSTAVDLTDIDHRRFLRTAATITAAFGAATPCALRLRPIVKRFVEVYGPTDTSTTAHRTELHRVGRLSQPQGCRV
jgi:hypothetical protein